MYFKLHTSIKITKGIQRSLITNTTNNSTLFIPNEMTDVINEFIGKNYTKRLSKFDKSDRIIVEEYFDFLLKNNLGFFCDSYNEYQNFEVQNDIIYEYPTKIDFCIIDITNNSPFSQNIEQLFNDIDSLQLRFLEIRIFENLNNNILYKMIDYLTIFNNSSISEINLVLNFNKEIVEKLKEIQIIKYLNVSFFNSSKNEKKKYAHKTFYFTQKTITSKLCCGIIASSKFIVNRYFIGESLDFNNCLNKKISIDLNGEIKNCPSMSKSYGNIKDTSLEQALNHPDFKKLWNTTKDHIKICKDCEFRYICMDCRAYVEDPENIYSKPLKCGYNPYTCEWEEWSKNPLKQKAIKYYRMEEIIQNN